MTNGVAWCLVSHAVAAQRGKATVFGEEGELKNWMLAQLVNNKRCSSIQFLLGVFYYEYKKVSLSFFGL